MTHRTDRRLRPDDRVPAGWPRPYNIPEDDPYYTPAHVHGDGSKPHYAQWIAVSMQAHVMGCHEDRTYTAGAYHLCSSCAHVMERGLLLDVKWANRNTPEHMRGETRIYARSGIRLGRLEPTVDVAFGSPLCYRCAVFAMTACPYFGDLHDVYGDALVWQVTTSSGDYEEPDDTSSVVPVRDDLERVTHAQVRADVQAGRLHILDVTADDLPLLVRPPEAEDFRGWNGGYAFDSIHDPHPKFSVEDAVAHAAARRGRPRA